MTPKPVADQLISALAHADRGDWNRAHEIVQDIEGALAAWIHANLHREEGDESNARYWYGLAGREFSRLDPAAERREIAAAVRADPK